MELSGLRNRIYEAAAHIDYGRKGFAVRGKELEGRIAYEDGIAEAFDAFSQAQMSADPKIIFLAEYYFLSQELELCDERDKNASASIKSAIESFDEALLCLEVVENHSGYKLAEKTHSQRSKYRIQGFPRDAFHLACASHRTRLKNSLSAIGIDPIEKSLLEQRRLNLTTAQNSYTKKQRLALK
ncbi:MAG: hypothetical protein LBI42_12785 [Chitinispirillales bacterium]|nr:hypothetical protein [Chitinispirillales bacterium]